MSDPLIRLMVNLGFVLSIYSPVLVTGTVILFTILAIRATRAVRGIHHELARLNDRMDGYSEERADAVRRADELAAAPARPDNIFTRTGPLNIR